MLFSVLDEPIVRFDLIDGTRAEGSLPQVYEVLMTDRVASFPALRPHQRHAWHAFLVQLGALALSRAAAAELPVRAGSWANALRGLTDRFPNDEPWHLMVSDITRPAFMQPPASSPQRALDYRRPVATPDELDMLRTAKNHDLKSSVAVGGTLDDWLLALVTVQTMDGFEGAGNYGIFRMNGGMGNRPAFSLAPAGGIGAHVRRDMTILLNRREEFLEIYSRAEPLHSLLWTLSWDGNKAEGLSPSQVDPFCIEICRRVRLFFDYWGRPHAKRATSRGPRVEARHLKGRTGDPWIPINQKESKALTVSRGGFTYRRVADYLTSGDYERPVLLIPTWNEQAAGDDMQLVARAMVRGQGKTEGYHERIIPVRAGTVRALGTEAGTQSLGDLSSERIEQVRIVQRILSHAIQTFVARGRPDNISQEARELARPWLNQLDEFVDTHYFEALQAEFEASTEEHPTLRRCWLSEIVGRARALLQDAIRTLPCPAAHRYRARTSAESLFERRLRSKDGLPLLFTKNR